LELPKFTKTAAELKTPLDQWLYFLRYADQLDPAALPARLDMPGMHKAMGELQMLAQSDLERERYEARLKFQRDYTTGLAEAREAGIRET
jgi:hypothetical protein